MQKGVTYIGFSTFLSVYNPECRAQSNKDFHALERKINPNAREQTNSNSQITNIVYTCIYMFWDNSPILTISYNHQWIGYIIILSLYRYVSGQMRKISQSFQVKSLPYSNTLQCWRGEIPKSSEDRPICHHVICSVAKIPIYLDLLEDTPKKYIYSPIDSPSSRCPIGKLKNHRQQIQDDLMLPARTSIDSGCSDIFPLNPMNNPWIIHDYPYKTRLNYH